LINSKRTFVLWNNSKTTINILKRIPAPWLGLLLLFATHILGSVWSDGGGCSATRAAHYENRTLFQQHVLVITRGNRKSNGGQTPRANVSWSITDRVMISNAMCTEPATHQQSNHANDIVTERRTERDVNDNNNNNNIIPPDGRLFSDFILFCHDEQNGTVVIVEAQSVLVFSLIV